MVLNDVPLFPLNTVLFPQMIFPLHIFEPRYRQMISECLKNNTPFGIILLRQGEAEEWRSPADPVPFTIGTLAKITEVVKLEDGRMLITAVGTERFRLLAHRSEKPFMTGDVEIWPEVEDSDSPQVLNELVIQVRAAFETYLKVLMELAGKQIEGLEIPADPAVLSYLVPNWLQIIIEDKQRLLEIPSAGERLREELAILRRETEFLRRIKEQSDAEEAQSQLEEEDAETETRASRYNLGERFSKN